MVIDTQAERYFMNRLGTESYQERISMMQKYQDIWELTEIEFQQELSINSLIFYAVSKQYGNVIFKILINNGFDDEISAMKAFQGTHFCRLHDYSIKDKVYIMERILPGITLYDSTVRKERIDIIAAIYRELHKDALPDSKFPTYMEWFEAGKIGTRRRKECAILNPYLLDAEQMLHEITKIYSRKQLLHGDLHHENILKNTKGGYTVIDPKGVIGDPVFDLSRFILDEFRDDLTSEAKDTITDFVQTLGDSVGIPRQILLKCLYIETVIWLFREELAKGESLEECESLITNMKVAYELIND